MRYFSKRIRTVRASFEAEIRKKHAVELEKIRCGRDYTDASWTAISRTPCLKALDLWFNGSGWNGGGWLSRGYNEHFAEYIKTLPHDLQLVKRFYYCTRKAAGYGCYWEEHSLCSGTEQLRNGNSWRWADYDARHKRIVFAENGAIYALPLKTWNAPPVMLY